MKRTAVYTFIDTENYGALLQACALSEICYRYNYQADFINSPKSFTKGIKYIKNKIWYIIRYLLGYRKRLIKTQQFKNSYINISTHDVMTKKYDKYIVGSDQVWNPYIINDNLTYLLAHIEDDSKKIAYAASFGIPQLPDDKVEIYRKYISRFAHVSTREQDGLQIIHQLGIDKGTICLDPTLLLTPTEWCNLMKINRYKSDYILCYLMPGNPSNNYIINYGKALANEYKLKIKIVGEREYKRLLSDIYTTDAGPKEFIELISKSAIVLTNSFHGTCFAINFNKPFKSFVWENNNADNRNSRIYSLLSLINLTDQLVKINNKTSVIHSQPFTSDFSHVNSILCAERQKSLRFIKDALN